MKNIGKISVYFMLACVVTNSNAMYEEPKQPNPQLTIDALLTINVDSVATPKAYKNQNPTATIEWLPSTPNTTPSPGSTPENRKQDFKSVNQASRARRNSQKPEISEATVLRDLRELWGKDNFSFSQICRQEDTAFQLACARFDEQENDEKTITAYLDVLYGIPLLSTEQIQSELDTQTYVRRYYWQYNVRYALYNADKLDTIRTILGHRAITETIWAGTFISITEICDMVHKHQASVDIVQYLVGYLEQQPESTQYVNRSLTIARKQYLTQAQVELQVLSKKFEQSLQIDQAREQRVSGSPSKARLQAQPQPAKWVTLPPVQKSSFDQDNTLPVVASPSLSNRTVASPRKELPQLPIHPARVVTEMGSSSGSSRRDSLTLPQIGSSPGTGRQPRKDSLPRLGEAPNARLLTVPTHLND